MTLRHSSFVILFAVVLASGPVASEPPPTASSLIERGLTTYMKADAAAAVKAFLKRSALEGNTQAASQANSLRQIEDVYGKAESFQILGEHPISERTTMVYFAVNYEKGPLFGRMQAYRRKSGEWVSTEFRFHTDAVQILPPKLAIGE